MASNQRRRQIECDDHGVCTAWAICRQLRKGRRLDFPQIEAAPADVTANGTL
jgi:hypothetical protein